MRRITVQAGVRNLVEQAPDEVIADDAFLRDALRHGGEGRFCSVCTCRGCGGGICAGARAHRLRVHNAGELGSACEADDTGDIFRAGATTALLFTAMQEARKLHATAQIEEADTLRAAQLVTARRHEVDLQFIDIERDMSVCLDGIRMEEDALARLLRMLLKARTDLCDRLDGADFVVRHHDADEQRVRTNRRHHRIRIDMALMVDRKIGHIEAPLLEIRAGMEDGMMLDHVGYDVTAFTGLSRADQRPVVRLGATAREVNFRWFRADGGRDGTTTAFYRCLRALAIGVDGGSIAILRGEIGHHRLQRFFRKRRGRRVIHIIVFHSSLFYLISRASVHVEKRCRFFKFPVYSILL